MTTTVDVVCPFCQGTKQRRMPTGRIISDMVTEKPELALMPCSECKTTGVYQATPIVEAQHDTVDFHARPNFD